MGSLCYFLWFAYENILKYLYEIVPFWEKPILQSSKANKYAKITREIQAAFLNLTDSDGHTLQIAFSFNYMASMLAFPLSLLL